MQPKKKEKISAYDKASKLYNKLLKISCHEYTDLSDAERER